MFVRFIFTNLSLSISIHLYLSLSISIYLYLSLSINSWMLSNSEISPTYHKTCIQPLPWSSECSQTLNAHQLTTRLAYNQCPGVINALKHWKLANLPQELHTTTALELNALKPWKLANVPQDLHTATVLEFWRLSNSWMLSNSEYLPKDSHTATALELNALKLLNSLKLWILANLPQYIHTATALEFWMLSNS